MPTDQENADTAQKMILQLINENKHIESRIWASSLISTLVLGYTTSGYQFSELR